mgnify:CR=1 FL=1
MRKSSAKERIVLPDPKFGDIVVTKFVNNLMLDGKKSTAFSIFYDAIDVVASKVEEEEDGSRRWFQFSTARATSAFFTRSLLFEGLFRVPRAVEIGEDVTHGCF